MKKIFKSPYSIVLVLTILFTLKVGEISAFQIILGDTITRDIRSRVIPKDEMDISIDTVIQTPSALSWFDKISITGYTQLRYNRLLETNPNLRCEQCDPSWGENGGFFLRRLRVEFQGYLNDRVYLYLMPEFAFGFNNSALLREGWVDVGLDRSNEFRLRFGQSRVPFGFDNLQDSRHRIAIDRTDAINSAQFNERDVGLFFYWAPIAVRQRFDALIQNGLKGANDHGLFGIGVYNGQGGNTPMSEVSHIAARVTYPFITPTGQIIEASLQGYTGTYQVATEIAEQNTFADRRLAASFIYYPQPFGVQAEFVMGTGPQYSRQQNTVVNSSLNGGYIQAMYFIRGETRRLFPYARYQFYDGGKKFELDATRHVVNELELGLEWHLDRAFEITAGYVFSDRTFENSLMPINQQYGQVLRLQFQAKF